jgi:hypothetical protein
VTIQGKLSICKSHDAFVTLYFPVRPLWVKVRVSGQVTSFPPRQWATKYNSGYTRCIPTAAQDVACLFPLRLVTVTARTSDTQKLVVYQTAMNSFPPPPPHTHTHTYIYIYMEPRSIVTFSQTPATCFYC